MKNTIQKRIFPFVLLLSLLAVLLCLAACDANEKNSVQTTQSAETGDTSHEHRFENTVVPPSCTEGYTLHVCTECGYSYTDTYTDALGHQFTDVRNDVDCNAYQTVTHTCLVCGYSYTEETQDRGTIHSMEPKTVVYPTQTAGGYTIFVCSRCGITENRDLTNPVNYSTGLQYTTYSGVTYVTGLGTCTDTDIVIPTVNEKGQKVAGLFDHAFGNAQLCSGIQSVTVPETSVIRPAAFSGCRNLVSLTIPLTYSLGDLFSYQQTPVNFPATITTVNIVGATLKEGIHLSGCPTLERVTLDERIREIPANFFSGCAALSDIRFSNSLSKIGDSAFYGTAIRSFTVPNAVTSIPYGAFAECKQLTAVNFHSGVRSIGQEAFYRCTRLASLELPTSLTTLGMTAFSGCTSLKTVEIPPSLTDLPEFAFSYCSSLSEIILHDSIRSIGFEAFCGTAIKSFTFPVGITEDLGAFNRCTSLTEIHYHAGMTKIGSLSECSKMRSIELPQGITEIPTYCFSKCTALEEIVIPASVKEIGYHAFEKCTSLRRVVLPEGLTVIDTNTFDGCTELTEINIPDSIREIKLSAFKDCKKLTNIHLPSSLSTIGQWAFSGSGLTELTIDRAVTLGTEAFSSCKSLKTVVISASSGYPTGLFQDCTALETVTINEGFTVITPSAFDGCSALKNLTLPSTLTTIGNYAFRGCSSLTELTLPKNLTAIDHGAFENCTAISTLVLHASGLAVDTSSFPLTTLIVGDGVEVLSSGICKNQTLLTSVTLPASLRIISKQAFLGCSALTEIVLSAGLKTIGDEAFCGSGLVSVCFSSPSLTVGNSAFRDCASLTEVNFGNGAVKLTGYAFYGCGVLTDLSGTSGLTIANDSDLPEQFHRVENGMHFCLTTLLYVDNDCIDSVVQIPDDVTAIADKTFRNNTVIREVHFPAGLKSIGVSAFEGCTRLQKVYLPDSVTAIGNSAFEGCTALTEIVFPDQLEVLPSRVLYGCTALSAVTLGGSIREIASDFYLSKNYFSLNGGPIRKLYAVHYPGTAQEWASVSITGESFLDVCTIVCTDRRITHTLTSGSTTGGNYTLDSDLTLTLTGKGFFEKSFSTNFIPYDRNVRRLVISEGITELSVKSTSGPLFPELEEVVFPSTLKSFPLDNFSDSPWYQNTTFYDENGLYILNNSLIRVRTDTAGLLELPAGIVQIGSAALWNCQNLTEVCVPAGVTKIGENAFFNCTSLVRIVLPEGLTEIEANAFWQCTALTDIELPTTLKKMGRSPFSICSSLETLTIPAGVSGFSVVATECDNLKSLIVKAPVKSGDQVVWYCDKLEIVVFAEGSTVLENTAIYDCRALRAVVIPQSVTKVECVYPPAALYFRSESNAESIRAAILARIASGKDINSYLYSETQPSAAGYWHFDENGLPVLWD